MNIRNIDLNLLHIFVAVYECNNITLAAKKLHMSQPAVSNAINRLNNALELKLFIKESRSIIPSATADCLYQDIKKCLQQIECCLSQQTYFDPASSNLTFRIAGGSYEVFTLFPKLMPYLQRQAPNMKIVSDLVTEEEIDNHLIDGKSDLILFFDRAAEQGICKDFVFSDSLVLVTGPKHTPMPSVLTFNDMAALDIISLGNNYDDRSPLLKAFKNHPKHRMSRLTSPNILDALCIVSVSTLAVIAPLQLCRNVARQIPLNIHKFVDQPQTIDLYLYWRESNTHKQGHTWLRNLIKSMIADTEAPESDIGVNAKGQSNGALVQTSKDNSEGKVLNSPDRALA
ncbi:MAG: LysR family transcriptional regulator [Gammaproteobacteria bacterium]